MITNHVMRLGGALLLWGTLAGCGVIHHRVETPTTKPIAFGPTLDQNYALVHPYTETERQVYFFFHWLPINYANGIEAAEKHLHEGDAIVNLRIHTKFTFTDLFLTLLTAGLFSTYTVETHGDVVRVAAPVPTTSGGTAVTPAPSTTIVVPAPTTP